MNCLKKFKCSDHTKKQKLSIKDIKSGDVTQLDWHINSFRERSQVFSKMNDIYNTECCPKDIRQPRFYQNVS